MILSSCCEVDFPENVFFGSFRRGGYGRDRLEGRRRGLDRQDIIFNEHTPV